MPIKDSKIDILKFISKTHREIHENRIKRELKVVITVIAFYAVCTAFRLKYFECNNDHMGFLIFLVYLCIAGIVVIYLQRSGKSNIFNQALSERCEKILMHLMVVKEEKNNSKSINDLIDELIKDYDKSGEIVKKHKEKIEKEKEEENQDHPSADRVYWQIYIVLFGAAISSLLINDPSIYFIIILIYLIFLIYYIILLNK